MFSLRNLLLLTGLLWVALHETLGDFPSSLQYILFLAGIVILGVPHGAADLLVEIRNQQSSRVSILAFLLRYLARLGGFAIILFMFPLVGLLIFLLIAAYHFGETDLNSLDNTTFTGKASILFHGLSILSIILLTHTRELEPFLSMVGTRQLDASAILRWLEEFRMILVAASCLFAWVSMWVHCSLHKGEWRRSGRRWALYYLPMVLILWRLPLLEGFTFYFIIWHSVLSLDCIVGYLCHQGIFSKKHVFGQIALFSTLAIGGILAVGLAGFMFASTTSMAWYVFMGLAVLTAPHMEVMHKMYQRLRTDSSGSLHTHLVRNRA